MTKNVIIRWQRPVNLQSIANKLSLDAAKLVYLGQYTALFLNEFNMSHKEESINWKDIEILCFLQASI